MPRQHKPPSKLSQAVQKYGVSAFVVGSFAAYALHERTLSSGSLPSAARPIVAQEATSAPTLAPAATQVPPTSAPTQAALVLGPQSPPATLTAPTAAPEPTAPDTQLPLASAPLRDGTYTGPVVDAYYGNVQIAATIKEGRLVDVQFLDYPHDRRTSTRINNIAMPYLTSEAIQAQRASVDIISGATLTSEAFVESLQSALDAAHA